METRDILKATDSTKRLVQDEEYYRLIFKKTEKIVSVIFYVSNSVETNQNNSLVMSDILEAARAAHNAVLESLEVRSHVAEDAIRKSAHTLIVLDSKLHIAEVSGVITGAVMNVLSGEIDTVLRGMNQYLGQTTAFDDMDYRVSRAPSRQHREVKTAHKDDSDKRVGSTSSRIAESQNELDRRERIKTVLEAKGEATITDITDIITDCSSKTIQRELNAMIEDKIIKREGERRWSKYSIA